MATGNPKSVQAVEDNSSARSEKETQPFDNKKEDTGLITLQSSAILDHSSTSKKPALDQRYNELLKMISEIGKDVKPTYTNSKSHADRLKRNITTARGVLRECLGELDKLGRHDISIRSI